MAEAQAPPPDLAGLDVAIRGAELMGWCALQARMSERQAHLSLGPGNRPLPVVLRADGSVELDTSPSGRFDLSPGDAMILCGGGLLGGPGGFDAPALVTVLARCAGFTAAAVAERIETAALAFRDGTGVGPVSVAVLRLPTTVATSSAATGELPSDETAPGQARRFVLAALEAMGTPPSVQEVAALLTSELVTNAVVHGLPPVRVSVQPREHSIRIVVSDAGPGRPQRRDPEPDSVGGRGVFLVDALSARWGTADTDDGGKAAWFELDL